jgi:hypothetical protein
MSKKSRRRNKKILGALGALGLGLALANRGKGTEMSNISVDSGRGGDSSSAAARVKANTKTPEKVYQDDIMRGGKGTKFVKPDLRFGQVIDKEGEVKTIRPFRDSGLTLGGGDKKLKLTDNSLRAKNRKVDIFGNKEPNKPMLATIFPKSQTADNYAADMRDFGRTMQYKKGGRVGCGIAKKGFGKAMKKGKK